MGFRFGDCGDYFLCRGVPDDQHLSTGDPMKRFHCARGLALAAVVGLGVKLAIVAIFGGAIGWGLLGRLFQ
jgi:hypothetical protein